MSDDLDADKIFEELIEPPLPSDKPPEGWEGHVSNQNFARIFKELGKVDNMRRQSRIRAALAYLGPAKSDGYQDRLRHLRDYYVALRSQPTPKGPSHG